MEPREYERMYHCEDTYWWFQGRLHMILALLESGMRRQPRPGRTLDVGCGTGLMLQKLARWRPTGIDVSLLALGYSRKRGLQNLVQGDITRLPFADGSMDLLLALDVMEHVERDDLMIREFRRVLRPGGWLMATVPAHPWLWSDHDRALHHHRRYTKGSLRKLLRHGDFRPRRLTYGISFMYYPIVAFRKLQGLWQRSAGMEQGRPKAHIIPLPGPLNKAMIGLLKVEAALLRRIDLPVGVSLMTLAQRARD
jgi:SAM-dependent methyltransferase